MIVFADAKVETTKPDSNQNKIYGKYFFIDNIMWKIIPSETQIISFGGIMSRGTVPNGTF